jgi:hypothetical protein
VNLPPVLRVSTPRKREDPGAAAIRNGSTRPQHTSRAEPEKRLKRAMGVRVLSFKDDSPWAMSKAVSLTGRLLARQRCQERT